MKSDTSAAEHVKEHVESTEPMTASSIARAVALWLIVLALAGAALLALSALAVWSIARVADRLGLPPTGLGSAALALLTLGVIIGCTRSISTAIRSTEERDTRLYTLAEIVADAVAYRMRPSRAAARKRTPRASSGG